MNVDQESQRKINKALQTLAANIIPPEEYTKNRTIVAHKILDHLKRKSRYNIGRVAFAGSSGKKTTIIGSDFDCVVFINNEEPLFESVLEDFEDCLSMTDGYNVHDVRKTKYSVQFQSSGFEFDLLPAPNFTVSCHLASEELIDMQQRKTLDKIKQNPSEYRYPYSSGISEAAVRFIKKQEGFVNEMVRLSKFWYKSVSVKSPPSGAKTLIELIAVYAANKEDAFDSKSYLRCFSSFLSLVKNFENLNIVFEDEYRKFPEHQVPDYIRIQRPIVLEPANPYNNLAKYWEKESMDLLKGYASETALRLERVHAFTNANGGVLYIPMELWFEPQPRHAQFASVSFQNPKLLVSSTSDVNSFPDMKVRKEEVMKIEGVARDLKIFQDYLSILLHGYVANPNVEISSQENLKKQAEVFIDKILGHSLRNWVSSNEKHEDYDVTYTIPLGKFSVLVSWKHS